MALTLGVAVPSGLFIPTILAGSALGRFVGEAANLIWPSQVVDAGAYALIGSAAMLGGTTRMTISIGESMRLDADAQRASAAHHCVYTRTLARARTPVRPQP